MNHKSKQPIVIDGFDKNHSPYLALLHSPRFVSLGYGIYFDDAEVNLSRVAVGKSDSALHIEYELPPLHDWGNWLSIRCEFDSVLNLTGYEGLRLDLKVEVPSDARLRVTLADVVDINRRGRDEIWWFDFKGDVLKGSKDQWQTLTLPFKDFYESYGAGTRHNDRNFDFSKMAAYEINIVSEGRAHPKGAVVVNSLLAF